VQTKERKLKVIEEEWKDCAKCPAMANSPIVFGYGNSDAKIAIIGGSPRTDIETEEMFEKIFDATGIDKDDVWFTNVCMCRAPEVDERSRAPKKKEIENCRPRLTKEISAVDPKIIVLAGSTALLAFTGKRRITQNRGWVIKPGDPGPAGTEFTIGVYATLHPASFFSGGEEQVKKKKQMAWEDWKEIAEVYNA